MTASSDWQRPRFHFLPARNWMNDPNGLIQWRGRFHLFYQYNPSGPFSGAKHWGHAVSDDLLRWEELPVALSPTPGGPDAGGCWSGCAVNDGGVPTFVYTGVHPQVVCLATGSADLIRWEKHPANPVIAAPPAELNTAGDFRDPFLWRDGGHWQMVIGLQIEGQGGAILRYRSADLVHWDYQGVLLQADRTHTKLFHEGGAWECPNFFPLGDQMVLMISAQAEAGGALQVVYFAGRWDGACFTPGAREILVHGHSFYAPQAMRLADGRTLIWGWLMETREPAASQAAGWSGVMSLPLALSWRPEGRLGIAPVEELKALRGRHWHFDELAVAPGLPVVLDGFAADGLELEAILQPEAAAEFGISLRRPGGGEQLARLIYDGGRERLVVETGEAGAAAGAGHVDQAPLSLDDRGQIRLRFFLDRSVLEVFANIHTCLVSRLYPAPADQLGLELFCRTGSVRVKTLDAWRLGLEAVVR